MVTAILKQNKQATSARRARKDRARNQGANPKPPVDYYAWRTAEASTAIGTLTLSIKPGLAEFAGSDPANLLLAESLEIGVGDNVLALNCGVGMVGMVAANLSQGGQTWMADASIIATEAARKTLAANEIKGIQVFESSGTRQLAEQMPATPIFDVVTVRLPKGKQLALQMLLDGYNALRPGGHLYLAGANNEGIKSYIRHLETLFGSATLLGYRKGCRVARAVRPEGNGPLPDLFQAPEFAHDYFSTITHTVDRKEISIQSAPGVFSWKELDSGTRNLLETMTTNPMSTNPMTINPTDNVLDLGCGNGILGISAAMRAKEGRVIMLDADINAIESARRSVRINEVSNCEVILSDCAARLSHATVKPPFDVVISNPPFHQGHGTQYEVAGQFIRDAKSGLSDQGRLYVVANRFLPYEELIQTAFGTCETLYSDSKFKVLTNQVSKA